MVKIIDFKISKNGNGKEFVSLQLQGDIEGIQSQQTGRFYLTAKTCSIPSTFNQSTAEALIGSEMPGKVVRVDSESYQYTIKETGEVITLNHRYEYRPDDSIMEFNPNSSRKPVINFAQ